MGVEALTRTGTGALVAPQTGADWEGWVSASRTRNFAMGDPLLDWLERYGEGRGFVRDTLLQGYDPRTDFTPFLFSQGRRFEEAVVAHLQTLVPVLTVAADHEAIRDVAAAEETFAAMLKGVPAIHQGVLWNAETRTYGAPDLLVRADVLARLFPGTLSAGETAQAAPDLGQWHYRIVDVKFTTLHLAQSGELANGGSAAAYKVQVWLYNEALGRIQGWTPPAAFLLGRSWEQGSGARAARGRSCMERLAFVPHDGTAAGGRPIAQLAHDAVAWMRRVRAEGDAWEVLPVPSLPELYPDMTNSQDGPWHAAKRGIAEQIGELTLLWQVGREKRRRAHAQGVRGWRDPRCTPEVVGVSGEKRPDTLIRLLDVNRDDDGPAVRPARVHAAEEAWRDSGRLAFYVDFETVNDLADDFRGIPERGGQPLIFMIGCGHVEGGAWQFSCFVAERIDEGAERAIIEAWLAHMAAVRARLSGGAEPLLVHWSAAETSTFETAYNAARMRHPGATWPALNWFDFLQRVVREEPVVVRGALGFGLKAIAKALHRHGLIATSWGDGPADGLGAMAGAWWCHEEAGRLGVAMGELPLMREIAAYNEVDCRVMEEAVAYLRREH